MPPRLRSLVVKGLRWKLVSQVIVQVAFLASTLILARLLTPRDFGLAGLALAFSGVAFLIADLGLGASIVQRPELSEEDRSTAFWTTVGLGAGLTVVGVGLRGPSPISFMNPSSSPCLPCSLRRFCSRRSEQPKVRC